MGTAARGMKSKMVWESSFFWLNFCDRRNPNKKQMWVSVSPFLKADFLSKRLVLIENHYLRLKMNASLAKPAEGELFTYVLI